MEDRDKRLAPKLDETIALLREGKGPAAIARELGISLSLAKKRSAAFKRGEYGDPPVVKATPKLGDDTPSKPTENITALPCEPTESQVEGMRRRLEATAGCLPPLPTFDELKQAIWSTTFSERPEIQQNGFRIYIQALKLEDELGLREDSLSEDERLLAKDTITSDELAQVLISKLKLPLPGERK